MLKDKPLAELLNETNRVLLKAVDKVIADNRPPAEMVEKLRNDVFVFSACKTHIELKELSSKLVTDDGKITSWNSFLKEATTLYKTYNENYLQAEYIFASSSAEMAARWVDVSKDGDRYNLQYRTAGDDRVRDAHDKLRGTTLPASDPFWDSYYPPNGWRCRCTAVQVLKEKYPVDNSAEKIRLADSETTQIDSKGRDRGAMFRFNPGKQQVIFPPNHPYYKVKQGIGNVISSLPSPKSKMIEERRQEYLKYKKDGNYFDVNFREENGGVKATHNLHSFHPKTGRYEKDAQNCLFQNGDSIILEKEHSAKGEKVIDGVRHPDGLFNEMICEISSIEGIGGDAVRRALKNCSSKNAEVAILYFTKPDLFSTDRLLKGIAKFNGLSTYRFKTIVYIVDGKVHKKSHL